MTDVIILVISAALGLGIWMVYGYLRKLPDRLHRYALTKSEYGLKGELEQLKATLLRDLELSKISEAQLQIHKTNEFLAFTSYFNELLAQPEKLKQVERDRKKKADFKQKMLDLGARLYFFGSDETIRTYLEFRRLGSEPQTPQSRMQILKTYGRLMLQMRRDIGYGDTALDEDDYLRLIIIDWDQHKNSA